MLTCAVAVTAPLSAGWLNQASKNQDTPAVRAEPAVDPTGGESAGDCASTEPSRIMMRGASSMPVKRFVSAEQEPMYVVTLPPGMDLAIEIECQPAKAIVPELMDPDGKQAELRDEGEGTWMGAVPATKDGKEADFILTLKKGKEGAAEVPFTLTVRVPEHGDEGDEGGEGVDNTGIDTSAAMSPQGKSDMRTVIAKSGLSLRAKPEPKAKKIATLPFGTVVEVISIDGPPDMYEGINAQWYNIRANGQEGWAFGGFIGEPGEMPTPEGSGLRGAIFNQPWETRKDGMRFFQLSDPGTKKLKMQNRTWLTLEKGRRSGAFEFTKDGYLFYDGVFLAREFIANFTTKADDPRNEMVPEMAEKLILSPASPSGRQIFITADKGGGCINEYLLDLDASLILNVCVSKYGVDEWIEWSKDGKSAELKYDTEGSTMYQRLHVKTGNVIHLKEVRTGE